MRATLLFTVAVRDILVNYGLGEFSLCREEAVFGCMKVFMLEHEQPQTDSSTEVFPDATVTRLMDTLLQPFTFTFGTISAQCSPDVGLSEKESLETVAAIASSTFRPLTSTSPVDAICDGASMG